MFLEETTCRTLAPRFKAVSSMILFRAIFVIIEKHMRSGEGKRGEGVNIKCSARYGRIETKDRHFTFACS